MCRGGGPNCGWSPSGMAASEEVALWDGRGGVGRECSRCWVGGWLNTCYAKGVLEAGMFGE